MLHFFRYLFLIFLSFFFTKAMSIETDWDVSEESKVRLISPLTHNNNFSEIFIGLEYQMNEGWKTYWQSPGEGGFPQNIIWENSTNIKSLKVKWPVPQEFEILDIKSLGYSDQVIFPLQLALVDPTLNTSLILDISYLTCKEICIPGVAHLELNIPPGNAELTKNFFILEKNLSQLPKELLDISFLKNISIDSYVDDKIVSFHINAEAKNLFNKPNIFLHTEFGLPVIKPEISLSADSKKLFANLVYNKNLISKKKFNVQLVVSNNKQESFIVNKKLILKDKKINLNNNYLYILLIAFIGGFILNLMPCVLPILSIKVISILNKIENPSSVRFSFITTSIGIICSFIFLALSFISIRNFGINIGWGMQFQQPIFLMIIFCILIFFTFNMFEIFEISFPNFLNSQFLSIKQNNIFLRDFFNGFFITLMATPCSAPFVGTALTFAFTQSSLMMLSIFILMGVGLSSPYLILFIFPKFLKFLPKPGVWMKYTKYFLGLLLLLTSIWIGNILLNHFNYYFFIITIFLFLILFLFFYYNKFVLTSFFCIIIIFFSLPFFKFFSNFQNNDDSNWLDITKIDYKETIYGSNIVFVDITADWCATCQFNKINVLNKESIKNLFSQYNVIKLRGDWTKPNKVIEVFLQDNKKFGIPFNVIYDTKNSKEIILPELLSEKEIIKIIEELDK